MKLEKATIENTKVGDKCYIEVEIKSVGDDEIYPIKSKYMLFTQNGKNNGNPDSPQLYHLIQEEIPTLGEGVEMEVSDDGLDWRKAKVIAISHLGKYLLSNHIYFKFARPIQLTLEQKLENALKEIEELKQQLNK